MKRLGLIVGWLLSFAVFCAFCACGQNTISVVTVFPHPHAQLPAVCQAQADILSQTIQRYPHPEAWHWVLLCDDPAWQHLLTHLDRRGEAVYALTDLEGSTTYLRGATLLRPDNAQARPDHVIAHELAHIALHDRDESLAEQLASGWLRHPLVSVGFAASKSL
jgi:hypothetical protein